MKILTLLGSRRRNGNTARAVSLLHEALREAAAGAGAAAAGLDLETVALGDLRIEPCRGCRSCFDRLEEHCPLKNDLLALRDRILQADGVILASPVYVNDVSGDMKTLIDRLAFTCHRPAFQRVPALVLATTGGSPARHTLRTLQGAWLSMGGPLAGAAGLRTGALCSPEEIRRRHGRTIEVLARRFLSFLQEKRYERPGFVSLMMFAVQQASWRRIRETKGVDTVDSRYWQERGWFDPRCTFFIPQRAPRPRVAAARAAGRLLARLFAG